MRGKKWFTLVFLVVALVALMASGASAYIIRGEIEQVWLVRPETRFIDEIYYPPEYLELEDLVFYTCVEEENLTIKSTVICRDDNSFDDLEVRQWSDRNCFIADYDLASHECTDVLIRSTYELGDEVVTLEQEIKENRLTSLMDHIENTQYSDGGWKDSIDTAYGVWAMSYFPEIYRREISLGLDWLKEYRDNDEKCWPTGTCSPLMTANIVGLLSLAEFNDSLRIIHDGMIWLERNQNYYQPTDIWEINVTPYFYDAECLISYDNEENITVNISLNSSFFYNFTPEYPKELFVICTEAAKVTALTQDGEEVTYYEGDNMSFEMPGAGWANGDRWTDTDVETTVWAMMTNITRERRDAALDWLVDELRLEGNKGKYIGPNRNITSAALYLFATNRSPIESENYDEDINYSFTDVLEWLRFEQNNDGSWGDGNVSINVEPTGDSVMSLLNVGFNRTDEVIEDAEEWTSENELEYGWNTTRKNSYAFYMLKNNARPFLKSVPRVVVMDSGTQTIELYNPTTYDLNDLSYSFSEELEDLIEIETQDGISAYSYIRLDIRQLQTDVQDTYGFLTIMNGDENISKIPVMVVSFPSINATPQDSVRVFGTKGSIKFSLVKTSDTFNCELSWDDTDVSGKSDFTFVNEKEFTLDVKFTKAERLEKEYTGDFICTTRDKSFLVPFRVNIDRYPSYPISVSPERIFINGSGVEPSFVVKNLLDETIDVSVAFVKSENFFDIEKSKLVLNPAEERNLTIYNVIPAGFNVTSTNTVEIMALGQKESIRFLVDVIGAPEVKLNPVVFWSLIAVLVASIAVLGYLGYKYRNQIKRLLHPGSKVEDVRNRIRTLEEKGTRMAITNYTRMLRFQGKSDAEVRKRLKGEGFKEKEIEEAFKNI